MATDTNQAQAVAEVDASPTAVTETTKNREGKYLTFVLADEEYGLEILKVREIFGYMDITAVPKTPPLLT